MSALFTQCPGDTEQIGTRKVQKFKCTTAVRDQNFTGKGLKAGRACLLATVYFFSTSYRAVLIFIYLFSLFIRHCNVYYRLEENSVVES